MLERKLFFSTLLTACLSNPAFAAGGNYPVDPASLAAGQKIAEAHCSACHAVGPEGQSAKADAPAFRDLSKLYPLESLEEPLAEGIVTAHENMPEFVFEPDDIDVFLGYLSSIQTN